MSNWIWIPVVAIAFFIFGGITGAVVTCIPFSKALRNIETIKNSDS